MKQLHKVFKHHNLYRTKEDIKNRFGFIPKGTILRYECPNMGFARFQMIASNWERLQKNYKATVVLLKPKIAFKIMEEIN